MRNTISYAGVTASSLTVHGTVEVDGLRAENLENHLRPVQADNLKTEVVEREDGSILLYYRCRNSYPSLLKVLDRLGRHGAANRLFRHD